MRLLNTTTLEFKEFLGDSSPYGILSHVWSDSEVSFQQFSLEVAEDGPEAFFEQCANFRHDPKYYGHNKIAQACQLLRDGISSTVFAPDYAPPLYRERESFIKLNWIWIDTCCIDKSSSAELSEAINSMFGYYSKAEVCLVFLPDVDSLPPDTTINLSDEWESRIVLQFDGLSLFKKLEFVRSIWFSRGWTLQELIAPSRILFFNSGFETIGHAHQYLRYHMLNHAPAEYPTLHGLIAEATDIDTSVLLENDLSDCCLAERMSWTAGRRTTREEDMAYCLLGLLGINLPLLYGEGAANAFYRLQAEIVARNADDSLFVWSGTASKFGLLADRYESSKDNSSLHDFRSLRHHSHEPSLVCPHYTLRRSVFTITQRGVETEIVLPSKFEGNPATGFWFLLPLQCRRGTLRCYLKIFFRNPAGFLYADDSLEGFRCGMVFLDADRELEVLSEANSTAFSGNLAWEKRWATKLVRRRLPSTVAGGTEMITPDGVRFPLSRKLRVYFPLDSAEGHAIYQGNEVWEPVQQHSANVDLDRVTLLLEKGGVKDRTGGDSP